MSKKQYQVQQLVKLLEALQSREASGVLYLDAEISSQQKQSCVLLWREGRIIYGGLSVPDAQSFSRTLFKKLNRQQIDLNAIQQTIDQPSIRAFLARLVEMQLFTWEQIETVIQNQVVLLLEKILPLAGQFQFNSGDQANICRSLELSKLLLEVNHRHERWHSLKPIITSREAVPHLQANALEHITDATVRGHLQKWVNGQRSLADIAEALDKDPLNVAQSYMHWVQVGWVVMSGSQPDTDTAPTILAVDDSAVMQEVIKRTLAGYCRVLVAKNAADALNIVCEENISLLLLDVSMPGIDGLELCRTIRGMPQFYELPIIMVTGRDGLHDKVQGKLAGATDYLTKPFDAEKLREIVCGYVDMGITFNMKSINTKFSSPVSN